MLIRMAAHADNFLLIFDDAKPLQLYKGRTTRLATPAQRLVLYAIERGCTHPGCDVPAYWCQAHHAENDWAAGGQTDIDELTLACGPRQPQGHNRRLENEKTPRRHHRMDPTPTPGPRPTPHQHLLPPGTHAAGRRGRRK